MELISLNPKICESVNEGVKKFVCDCPICGCKSIISFYVRTINELYPALIPHHRMKGNLQTATITPSICFNHNQCHGKITIEDGIVNFIN